MATLEPAQALNACETAIRELMDFEYRSAFGADWLTTVASDEQRNKWSERARLERGRLRKGVAEVPDGGVAYSEFRNYANDGVGADLEADQQGIEASMELPHDAVGTDHGSLGVFQQQWPSQRLQAVTEPHHCRD